MNRHMWILPVLLLVSLLLMVSGAWAFQEVSKSSSITLVQNIGGELMATDISLKASMRLANDTTGAGPAIIYIPRIISNSQDLSPGAGPNGTAIYMCPGQLTVVINEKSTWNTVSRTFNADADYPLPAVRACPNILFNQCGNQCNTPCGAPASTNGLVEWMNNQTYMSGLRGRIPKYVDQTAPSDYNPICTNLAINATYHPILGGPPIYPQQPGEAGLMCAGAEWVTVDSTPMTRPADSAVSPGPIASLGTPPCNPTANDTWVTGRMAVGAHNIKSLLGSQQCLSFVHLLPNVANPAANWKNIYIDRFAGFPAVALNTTPANWTVVVVDPRNCSVNATVSPIYIQPQASASYLLNVTIINPSDFFDMVADGVNLTSAPEPGWNVSKGPTPNGFSPGIIPAKGNSTLWVTLTSPIRMTIKTGCINLNVSLHSARPMCNQQLCNTNVTVQVCLLDTGDDLASAIVAPSSMALGQVVQIEAITYNNGSRPTPILTNTSVSITGQPTRYFSVPLGLPITSFPSASDPQKPDPPYSNNANPHLYTYSCDFPHIVSVTVYSDYTKVLPELNENNNIFTRIIICGRRLSCPDYV